MADTVMMFSPEAPNGRIFSVEEAEKLGKSWVDSPTKLPKSATKDDKAE